MGLGTGLAGRGGPLGSTWQEAEQGEAQEDTPGKHDHRPQDNRAHPTA